MSEIQKKESVSLNFQRVIHSVIHNFTVLKKIPIAQQNSAERRYIVT